MANTQIAIIIGASRGIGYVSAYALAKAGRDVVVAARTEKDLSHLVNEVQALGRRAMAVKVDVLNKKDIEHAMRRTVDTFGRVDVLVYSSGVFYPERTIVESTDEHFEETMAVNLRGAYWAVRSVLTQGKMLEEKSGRIIILGSDASKMGSAGSAVYTASKHALLGLVRCVALEVGAASITINAVCPGFVWTKMAQDVATQFAGFYGVKPKDSLEFLKGFDPLKRISTPEEVADLVVYLATTAGGGATTGQGFNMATVAMS